MRNFNSYVVAICISAFIQSFAVAQRDLRDIPPPDPKEEQTTFIVPEGFEVNLYAADPQIAKPIHMSFDAEGKLWIASSEVYPQIKPGQKSTDKILCIEDTNQDGTADKTTVFADGLLIPTGVLPGDGGVYLANSTELLHLKDTDGDGRADKRRIVLTGFGTEDTHHILHTLRWGPDGNLYMNQSIYIHSHLETPHGVRRLNGGGIWRFRPDTMELDVLCKGFVNTWGHHFDHWGQSFATDGAYGEGINFVFPGSVFISSPGEPRIMKGLNPGSPKHCGLEILSGRHLPEDWRGSMITNDFRAHRVCRFKVTEDGSAYASKQEVEPIKTRHVAFRPIDVKMGPDGAIYIADWYNPIIQHGEVDFRDPRRDHVHGRIWRITAKGRDLVPRVEIVGAPINELLEILKSPEEWNRLWAKQELKNHPSEAVVAAVEKWVAALDKNDPEFEHHRLEALWALQTINAPNEKLLIEVLASPDHRARAAAVRIASQWQNQLSRPTALFAAAVEDEHPRVRLEGIRALAQVPTAQAAVLALSALDKPMDQFLDFALWRTMRDLAPIWLPALQRGELDFGSNTEQLTFALKAVDSPGVVGPLMNLIAAGKVPPERQASVLTLVATLGGPKELRQVFDLVLKNPAGVDGTQRAALLAAAAQASQARRITPEGDLSTIATLFADDSSPLRSAAAKAAGIWKVEPAREALNSWLVGDDTKADAENKAAAIEGLALLGGEASRDTLAALAAKANNAQLQIQAIAGLAALDEAAAAAQAAQLLATLPASENPAKIIAPFAARTSGPAALAKALEGKKLSPDMAKLAVRAAKNGAGDISALEAALRTAGGLSITPEKPSPELIAAIVAEAKSHGDPARGEAIYRRGELQCQKCHAVGAAGGIVGPDLISIGASAQPDYLVESLLDPSAKVKENYHSIIVETDEGKIYSGIPIRKTETEWVLRDQNDQETTVPIASIEDSREGRSLMPEGLTEPLTRAELVDLVRFLSELGKEGPFAIGKEPVARTWRALQSSDEGHRRLNRTSLDTAASDDPALTWAPVYSTVAGVLPVDDLPQFTIHQGQPPVSVVNCDLDVTAPGKIGIKFASLDGLSLWVDGQPVPLEAVTVLDLKAGRHTLTLAVNRIARTAPLRLELQEVEGSTAKAAIVGGK